MKLILLHPQVSARDCRHCIEWQYDEDTGKVLERLGEPVRRPEGASPPCRLRGIGCAKGTPENPKTLSAKNQRAYQHYLECRAVGQFPDDSLVRSHAAIIGLVHDSLDRQHQEESLIYLRAVARMPRLGVTGG